MFLTFVVFSAKQLSTYWICPESSFINLDRTICAGLSSPPMRITGFVLVHVSVRMLIISSRTSL